MKIFAFIFTLLITAALIFVLNNSMGMLPPLGKLLDPFKGLWQNARPELARDSNYTIRGLKNEVSVVYDDRLVPHIFARNDEDLYFMQGYVTARHRLWQMEFQTHAAAGRISEIIGERALDFDKRQRRIGMVEAAKEAEKAMMSDTLSAMMVTSFTNGVNAYITSLKPGKYPFEYKLLNYSPEPWTTLKSALLLKYMANMLSGYENDLEYTNALLLFGEENIKLLYPDYFPNQEPIIPPGTDFNYTENDTTNNSLLNTHIITNILKDKPDPDNGSNNWAVAGSKTASGKPILCNDPHLGLNLPSIWFEVQLTAPGINCYGVTIPGAPGIIIGFNDSVAWGVTNSERDVRDWFRMQFKDDSRNEYLYDGQWLKTNKIIEEIKIAGKELIYDTVIYTHLGPVVYDPLFTENKQNQKQDFALKWQAHQPSNESKTFYYLNRAKNYDEYVHALNYYESPAQNFVFASASGDIAIWNQGSFPAKKPGQGKFLLDGTTSESDWKEYIPQHLNPHIKNPERGYVSSANQHPTDTTYPYYYSGIFEYFRNRRINYILENSKQISPQDMMQLQNDNYNLLAEEVLPFMRSKVNTDQLNENQKKIFNVLAKWNNFNDHDLIAPSYFEIWWNVFNNFLWDELTNDSVAFVFPTYATTSLFILNESENIFYDIKETPETESLDDLINLSFIASADSVAAWNERMKKPITWQNYKATSVNHLARLESFGVKNIPVGGNKHIVNATGPNKGPSWRMIVSLDEPVRAWGIYPGGQSGNPASSHYIDMIEKWAAGEYFELLFLKSKEDKNKRINFTINFKPDTRK